MQGTFVGEPHAAERDRLGLLLRCGVSALALSAFTLAGPAAAQNNPGATGDTAGTAEAAAQDTPTPAAGTAQDDDAIIVTGIRASLRRSRDIKRDSDVTVDSITAEDISALPDRSVTEAIQRIPGVAINRFAAGVDPDHFSAEGSGVTVRGLTYVRSELNGRDSFTANNGRGLSFADVPSELLGGVDVFKSPSADMIEGGISGVVNLRTRLPFDNQGLVLHGSAEVNWGDMRREYAPSFTVLASNRWEGDWGEFGILASFTYSNIQWRNEALQISNYGRRTLYTSGDVVPNGGADAPVGGATCTTGAEASCVFIPRGAVERTQDTNRTRYGYAAAAQYRSPNRDVLATVQFLRSDARESWTERALEITTDVVAAQGDSRRAPGTTLSFDADGVFESGTITGITGWRDDQNNTSAWGGNGDVRTPRFGLQSNNQRRDREDQLVTTDISGNVRWEVSDRVSVNIDYQHVDSTVDVLDTTLWLSTFQNASIDMNGTGLPVIRFLPPEVCFGPATNSPCTDLAGGASDQDPNYFSAGHTSFGDPFNSFYRAAMDHLEQSEGNEDAFRADLEWRFGEESWLDSLRVGYRYSNRHNIARFSQYNWGVLSEIWGGRGPVWVSDPVDGNPNTNGGTNTLDANELFTFPDWLRGQVGDPQSGDPRLFYATNTARDYEAMSAFALRIGDEWRARNGANGCPQNWVPLAMRCGVISGSPFRPGEINAIEEDNNAGYAVLRFSNEFSSGVRLSGNVGVRYTRTQRSAEGNQVFNQVTFTDDYNPANPVSGTCGAPPPPPPPGSPPIPPQAPTPFCALPANVRAAARAWSNGAITPSTVSINYDYFLPMLNLKLEVGHGIQFRFAFNNNITQPDFGLTRNFYNLTLAANAEDIAAGGGLPVARATVGNPYLRPIESSNWDLSAEWYFSDVGQVTLALFYKRLHGVLTNDTARLPFTNNGATFDAIVTTPGNSTETGTVKGFEVSYQQVFDFLPGPLAGLGLNATYTYVDSSGVPQNTLSGTDPDVAAGRTANVDTSLLPLQGLSKHTINITPFFERGPISLRLAYNWRSRFLLTVRDVIVPFAPIYNEGTGTLDGSFFYRINDHITLGVQASNILNEVLRTSQVIDNSLLRAPRSWYMNDRRLTGTIRIRM
jgi:TonB-dependent receptor